MISAGVWYPDLFPRQWELMRMCRDPEDIEKYILLHGPRYASKTIAAANAIIDHCWNCDANVAIIASSITVGEDGGFWEILTDTIIPEWIAGDFGLDWWPDRGRPRQKGTSKKLTCSITNKFGRQSKIQLNSLKEEREVEKNFKGRGFSMIYISEASEIIKKYESYNTLINCLRIKGMRRGLHIMLLDTNPPKNGEENWMYGEWFTFRNTNPLLLSDNDRERQKSLKAIQFVPDHNLSLSEEFKQRKKAEFAAAGPDYYDRYWLGLWKKAKEGTLFNDVFKTVLHVIGDPRDSDPEIIIPEADCVELMTSWDFGPSNPFVCLCEKIFHLFPGEEEPKSVFKFFDEIGFLGETEMSLGDFTHLITEKMDAWEQHVGRKVRWTHYSDRSAFDIRESISNIFQYQEVFAASDGRIELTAVDKKPGSLSQAIRLWRKLLLQERLLFCATKTPKLIEMNQCISSGEQGRPVAKNSPYKHPFDAARYLIMRECWTENMESILKINASGKTPGKIINLPL